MVLTEILFKLNSAHSIMSYVRESITYSSITRYLKALSSKTSNNWTMFVCFNLQTIINISITSADINHFIQLHTN